MLCVIKLNKFTKAFPLVDLIPFFFFFGEDNPGATITHFGFYARTFLVAGWIHQWASEVSGNEGIEVTLPQIIPLGGPQMGPKSTPFFM